MKEQENKASQSEDALIDGVVRLLGDARKGRLHLQDVKSKAAMALAKYGRFVSELLRDSGVHVPPAVNLQTGSDGHIHVIGDHPDRERIEQLFSAHPQLQKGFKEVEVVHEIIRTEEEAVEFRKAHQSDPKQADKLKAANDLAPIFNLGITSGGPVIFFSTTA